MSGKSLAMMPWFPRDFIAATRHLALAERGAYRELLDYQWEMGALPNDPVRLARLLAITPEEFTPIWAAIRDKFEIVEGRLINNRLEEHRKKAVDQLTKKIKGAEATNAKRYGQRQDPTAHSASDSESHSDTLTVSPPSPSPSPSLRRVVEQSQGAMAEAGSMASDLRNLGIDVSSMHPTLIDWVKDGFTLTQLHEAVERARLAKPSPQKIAANYLDTVLRNPPRGPPKRLGKFDSARAEMGETKDVGFG